MEIIFSNLYFYFSAKVLSQQFVLSIKYIHKHFQLDRYVFL